MNELYLHLLQAVALKDMTEARLIAAQLCHDAPHDIPQDFLAWLGPHLAEPQSPSDSPYQLPPELERLLIFEDVSKTFVPERYWVSEREKKVLEDIISQNDACHLLEAAKIPFLNATLLWGQSGTGKSQFGRYLAYTMGKPFVYVNLCNMVGASLGETGRNLRSIFDFVEGIPCVFMLDELDAIAVNRGSIATGGSGDEMTRTTIGLMQCMDTVRKDVVLLAATNRKDMLDAAVLRRFTAIHELKAFLPDEAVEMVVSYLTNVKETGGLSLTWDEKDIREQCQIGRAQGELINLCNRAIVRAVQNDNVIRLTAEDERARKNRWNLKIYKETDTMAKFQQTYNPDGSYEERLSFAGKEFIFRRSPFKAGIAKGLDADISDQVEAAFPNLPNLEGVCNRICDMTDGFEDGQDVIPMLTKLEKKMEKEQE